MMPDGDESDLEELNRMGVLVKHELEVQVEATGRIDGIACVHPDHYRPPSIRQRLRRRREGLQPSPDRGGPWHAGPFDEFGSAKIAAFAHIENAGHTKGVSEVLSSGWAPSWRMLNVMVFTTMIGPALLYAWLNPTTLAVRALHALVLIALGFINGMTFQRQRDARLEGRRALNLIESSTNPPPPPPEEAP